MSVPLLLPQDAYLFFLKVAVKVIDKTQLNPTSLQKVRERPPRLLEMARSRPGSPFTSPVCL